MANKEQVIILLKEGIEGWNKWQKVNYSEEIDLIRVMVHL